MYPINQIKLMQDDVADPKRRRAVFREAGKTLTWAQDVITDRPGAIARLMELAFEAGKASASRGRPTANVPRRRMRDIDVPSLSRAIFADLRRSKVGASRHGAAPSLNDFRFILLPGDPHVPMRLSGDRWVECGKRIDFSRSNKAIRPLLKMGLFWEATIELADGSSAVSAELTEWGFELLVTGVTAFAEDRVDGTSSTFQSFRAVTQQRPMPTMAGTLSVWDLQQASAAFILEQTVHGVGRRAGKEDDLCAEDLGYRREVLDSAGSWGRLETWRLYRPNLDLRPLFRDDVSSLLSDGLLMEWDPTTLLLSEWGYELIVTGQTAVGDRRVRGQSATYADYQAIWARHAK